MLRVLFCSPYLSSDKIIKGGINTWGNYIFSYYKEIATNEVTLIPVSFDRKTLITDRCNFLIKILKGLKELWKPIFQAVFIMHKKRVDLMHLCTACGFGLIRDYFLIKIALLYGVRTVIHLHFGRIPELAQLNNWEWKLLVKVMRNSDTIIVMNRPCELALLDLGFKNIKYLPNPLGHDVLNLISRDAGKYKRVDGTILFVGHVLVTKGVYELVYACSELTNIQLKIVGKYIPQVRSDLEKIASIRDNGSWLHLIGEVSHEDVIKEFYKADIFVFPSYTEGFPNVILEAMACGCPIVSSNVGAIPEMLDIGGEDCGLCFEPRSKNEVFNSIIKVINDTELKNKYSINARNRVFNRYTISTVWSQLERIWDETQLKQK